jgi:hypothetical protein
MVIDDGVFRSRHAKNVILFFKRYFSMQTLWCGRAKEDRNRVSSKLKFWILRAEDIALSGRPLCFEAHSSDEKRTSMTILTICGSNVRVRLCPFWLF